MKNDKIILSGFNDLDAATGGFKKGDLIVLASRPSQGKTSLALNIVYNVALKQCLPVALFSPQIKEKYVYEKMACAAAKINIRKLSINMLKKEEGEALNSEFEKIGKSPLFICDKPALYVKDIKNYIKELFEQGEKPEFIVIDYFDLIRREKKESRAQNMRDLKEIAVKFNVPILVCSQICRKKKGDPKHPELANLRYPQFAEIADFIMFLYKEYHYKRGYKNKYSTDILIKKPFQTETEIELKWSPEYCSFGNIEKPLDKEWVEEMLKKYWHPTKKMNRQKCNLEILEELKKFLEKHPDMRFIQALWALNIVDKEDRFYEEPEITLKKITEAKKQL